MSYIATDGPGEYHVVAVSTAGSSPNAFASLQPGQVTRIATGAPLPPGADSVVMVEATRLVKAKEGEEDIIAIDESVRFGQDVREIGSDVQKGDTVLHRGDIIYAAEIGILSSMGIVNVQIFFCYYQANQIIDSDNNHRSKSTRNQRSQCFLQEMRLLILKTMEVLDMVNSTIQTGPVC